MRCFSICLVLLFTIVPTGCEKSDSPSGAAQPPAPAASSSQSDSGPRSVEISPAPTSKTSTHGGETIDLGTQKLGEFNVRASRDKGALEPGGEAPVDVWVDGGMGQGVAAVRFWIGSQDAKGSIKAKAEVEHEKWHTHVELPMPMPADAKLWVEIEKSTGEKTSGSFDLKP